MNKNLALVILIVGFVYLSRSFATANPFQTSNVQITHNNAHEVTLLDVLVFRSGVNKLSYSSTGSIIALAGNSDVQVWDYSTLAPLNDGIHLEGRLIGIAYSGQNPAETLALVSVPDSRNGVAIDYWDSNGLQQQRTLDLRTIDGDIVTHIYPEGQLLATYDAFGSEFSIGIWNMEDGEKLHTLRGHNRELLGVEFSIAGNHLISYARDDTIRLWNLTTGDKEFVVSHEDVLNIELGAANNLLATGSVTDVRIWSTETGEEIAILPHRILVTDLAISLDGTVLATVDGSDIKLWDTQTDMLFSTLDAHETNVNGIVFSPDGTVLASYDNPLSGSLPAVILWDVSTGQFINRISVGTESAISDISFSPDGSTLIILSGGGALIYGVPSVTRSAAQAIPARIIPSSVNLRAGPSSESPILDVVFSQVVIVSGRDSAGQYVYLPEFNGWILAGSSYIDLKGMLVESLPVRTGP